MGSGPEAGSHMEGQLRGLLCCRRARPGVSLKQSALLVDAWRRFTRVLLRIARLRRIWAFLGHHLDPVIPRIVVFSMRSLAH